MDPIRLTTQQALLYALLINAGIGFVIGMIPLILGFAKGKVKLGVFGLLAATIGGGILGLLLSIPAAVIFVWLILKSPAEVVVVNKEPIDVAVKNEDVE
jgi:hypothetical protein